MPAHSPGDTVTYTIHLENTGTAAGVVTLSDEIPAGAASWQLIDDGGGTDKSVGDTLVIEGLALAPGQTAEVVLEIVLADLPDLTPILNTAELSGDGGPVELVAPDLLLRRDGDGDGLFDSEDNCPELANPDQADADMNGLPHSSFSHGLTTVISCPRRAPRESTSAYAPQNPRKTTAVTGSNNFL